MCNGGQIAGEVKMDEQAFLTAVVMITEKHGCSIVEIDLKDKIKMNVSCPDNKSKVLCNVELGELLENYTGGKDEDVK